MTKPYARHPKDLTGLRFGRLVVLSQAFRTDYKNKQETHWNVRCDCGTEKVVSRGALTVIGKNATISCGCYRREHGYVLAEERQLGQLGKPYRLKKKHGHCSNRKVSRTWWSWNSMIRRCRDKTKDDKYYRLKGITVCERWIGEDGFTNFLADMGERPDRMTLDRIDHDGNYEPSNCRWADYVTQANNTSRAIKYRARCADYI